MTSRGQEDHQHIEKPLKLVPEAAEKGNLLFVPYGTPGTSSSALAGEISIRQHVMQDFFRKKSLNRLESPNAANTAQPSGHLSARLGRFKIQRTASEKPLDFKFIAPRPPLQSSATISYSPNEAHKQSMTSPNPPIQDLVSSYQRDPFVRFPFPANEEVQSLFTSYVASLNTQGQLQSHELDFLTVALGNTACFLMLMTTLVQIQNFQGGRNENPFWQYRGAAIAALQRELSDTGKVTDGVIWTVSMLAYTDIRCPKLPPMTAKAHLSALIQILNTRRGSLTPQLCCMLLRLTNWCLIYPPLPEVPSTTIRQGEHLAFQTIFPNQEEDSVQIPSSMFDDVKFLLRSKIDDPADPEYNKITCKNSATDFQEFLSSRLTFVASALGNYEPSDPAVTSMIRSIHLSKILFLYIVSPALTISGVSPSSIAISLRTSLELGFLAPGSPAIWKPELLGWVLMTGAVTPQDGTDLAWFVKRAGEFSALHHIHHFDELAQLLQKVAWSDGEFARECQRVWTQIERKKDQNS